MPKVYNKHHGDAPKDAVYVGRPTEWGNPFTHMRGTVAAFKVDDRDQAIKSFEEHLNERPHLKEKIKEQLKGKDLVCWCAPLPCHADILLRIANED